MNKSTVRELLADSEVGSTVELAGWVRTRRDSKEFSFLELNDGSCLSNIQVVADAGISCYAEHVLKASTGSAVKVIGELIESPGKGQRVEVKATEVTLVGSAPSDYPLQKKRHTNEYLRTIAHLRPRTNTFGAVFRVRHAVAMAIHKFFDERNFVYLHSPIITTSDCEGAGEMFRVSTLDAANPPRVDGKSDGPVDYSQDFFGAEASLTVSGQLEAEIFALALSNVYTFGPTFRAENSNTPRHLAEFWMIEPE
ncbi:MAG: asparagine--tRNA ligase, partial [Bdellovibrionales bacterium]|nr:asparagine--tRNA ligase [Bdellovibrionales bacterium]